MAGILEAMAALNTRSISGKLMDRTFAEKDTCFQHAVIAVQANLSPRDSITRETMDYMVDMPAPTTETVIGELINLGKMVGIELVGAEIPSIVTQSAEEMRTMYRIPEGIPIAKLEPGEQANLEVVNKLLIMQHTMDPNCAHIEATGKNFVFNFPSSSNCQGGAEGIEFSREIGFTEILVLELTKALISDK